VSVELNPALLQTSAAGAAAGPTAPAGARSPAGEGAPASTSSSFADALKHASAADAPRLHFSKHAVERIQRRGISLDSTTLGRLQEGVARIKAKGANDSLVLVDGTAFVVSVPNRTVITAVGPEHMREHVFTNIDSAAIA
jgi:flagellar operon protein